MTPDSRPLISAYVPAPAEAPAVHRMVLGMRVDRTDYDTASAQIVVWADAGRRGYVCAANVHMCMECVDHADFKQVVNGALMVTPDGMPLVWMLRLLGCRRPSRVRGPELTIRVLERAAKTGTRIGLYGGLASTLERLAPLYRERFPGLQLTYAYSPPFRKLEATEEDAIFKELADGGVQILFVSLGCPKQERWMATHKHRFNGIMVGVGAAFAFHTGEAVQAPLWAQRLGLEWAFRLATEPRRLWYRYLYHSPRFVCMAAWQLLRRRSS